MNHYIKLSEGSIIVGYALSDAPPDNTWESIDLDLAGITSKPTRYFWDGTAAVDTQQPYFPPNTWSSWDSNTRAWVDSRTLEQLKEAQWNLIKQARNTAEYGGFAWNGFVFDSDEVSQQRIGNAVQLAQLNQTNQDYTTEWTLQDNSVIELTPQSLVSVGLALGQHIISVHSKARMLRQLIIQAESKEGVISVVW